MVVVLHNRLFAVIDYIAFGSPRQAALLLKIKDSQPEGEQTRSVLCVSMPFYIYVQRYKYLRIGALRKRGWLSWRLAYSFLLSLRRNDVSLLIEASVDVAPARRSLGTQPADDHGDVIHHIPGSKLRVASSQLCRPRSSYQTGSAAQGSNEKWRPAQFKPGGPSSLTQRSQASLARAWPSRQAVVLHRTALHNRVLPKDQYKRGGGLVVGRVPDCSPHSAATAALHSYFHTSFHHCSGRPVNSKHVDIPTAYATKQNSQKAIQAAQVRAYTRIIGFTLQLLSAFTAQDVVCFEHSSFPESLKPFASSRCPEASRWGIT